MKKKKQVPAARIAVVLAFVCAAGLLLFCWKRFMPTSKRMSADEYFGSLAEGEAAVSVEDRVADERAVWIDDRLYVDYSLVRTELNPRFHWDASVGLMLFTTAEEIFEIPVNSSSYTEGGEAKDAGYEIVKQDTDKMYLAMEFLQQHSDFTYEILEEPSRIAVEFGGVTVTEATMKKDSAVRYQGGIKSPILTQAKKGTRVTVLEQMEKWSKVRTTDGYFGYVQNKRLTDIAEVERPSVYTGPAYTCMSVDGKLNLVWHQIDYAGMNENLASDTGAISGVNVISPTWYFLTDNAGSVGSFADVSYVEQAHAAGLQVWALIRNFGEGVDTTQILASRAARQKIQEYLVAQADEIGFDGINIDFEGIMEEAAYDYVQFMRELSILCRKKGLVLSVDVPVPMDFSSYYDREELGVVCDYVIMMGYDEHYAGSDIVGSVASLDFERNGIRNMLSEVPKEKVVSAIPFYTRLWYTETLADGSTSVTSESLGMAGAWQVLEENGVQAVWDEDAEQPYGEWIDAQGRLCQIWLEDDSTVAERAALVSENDLGGIAAWVLGQEMDYVWSVISENIA